MSSKKSGLNFNSGEIKLTFERFFNLIDIDKDGEITWEEFVEFQARAKKSLKASWPFDLTQIRREFSDIDADGSGKISRQEFLDALSNTCNDISALVSLSEMLDVIETKSLETGVSGLNSPKAEEFVQKMMADFDRADQNGDGGLDFGEYLRKIWSDQDQTEAPLTMKRIRKEFKTIDKNRDGKISREEFRELAMKIALENIQEY